MTAESPLTVTALLAAASDVLERSAYRRVESADADQWPHAAARVYEDPYSIVAVTVYETWALLADTWQQAQATLVDLISRHLTKGEPKAWDGYLVLLTPSVVPANSRGEVIEIRRDTTFVRKLVASADDIHSVDDVPSALLPLLPLDGDPRSADSRSALDVLPEALSRSGISAEAVRVAIGAYLGQQPIVEALHESLAGERGDAR